MIRGYTREAGVRNLEREIALALPARSRAAARKGTNAPVALTRDTVVELLGAPRYLDEEIEERTKNPGVAIGLAWTPVGGEVLFIEASRMAGHGHADADRPPRRRHEGVGARGALVVPGARRAVQRRSATSTRSSEIHLHVPSGAIPKDGPSAGVTMAMALASELTGRPVRGDIAMTGEITLSGRVLPVGGIKEKVLAARRLGHARRSFCRGRTTRT